MELYRFFLKLTDFFSLFSKIYEYLPNYSHTFYFFVKRKLLALPILFRTLIIHQALITPPIQIYRPFQQQFYLPNCKLPPFNRCSHHSFQHYAFAIYYLRLTEVFLLDYVSARSTRFCRLSFELECSVVTRWRY